MKTGKFISEALSIMLVACVLVALIAFNAQAASWVFAGSLASGRDTNIATLLPNGKVLVAGGYKDGVITASVEQYDPTTNSWSSLDSMATPRWAHTATLLQNGKVLIVGGNNSTSSTSGWNTSAELYDPATNSWSAAGSLAIARANHSASLLPNGKVLVVGGQGGNNETFLNAEIYDPATNSWSSSGSLTTARWGHTATLLPNNRILVVGGYATGGVYIASAETYDPATGNWSSAGSLTTGRYSHIAIMMTNGKVLIAGGFNGAALASTELYTPSTNSWSTAGTFETARHGLSATNLPNGKVLVVGGRSAISPPGNDGLSTVDIYDSTTNSWGAVAPLLVGRHSHRAILLPNGTVLVTGGRGVSGTLASAEIYDPATPSWSATGSMGAMRSHHTASPLPNGKVLVVGGNYGGNVFSGSELYDPITGAFTVSGSMTTKRDNYSATVIPSGKVLVAGGHSGTSYLSSAELYDSATGTFDTTGSMATTRTGHTATLLANGKILIIGGSNNVGYLNSAELYDPTTGLFTSTGSTSTPRVWHTATLLPNGKVLVAGGYSRSTAELFDPATGTFTLTGSMSTIRDAHTATLLPNGKVLVTGGQSSSPFLNSAELYDPNTGTFTLTGSMGTARYRFLATLLPNGKVLVSGGMTTNSIYLSSSELYDPATGTFSATGNMTTARGEFHTTTLLANGKVLAIGGFDGSSYLSSAELFDVGLGFNNSWRPTITTATNPLLLGSNLLITGSGFKGFGNTEASGGSYNNSATNYPLVQLRSIGNDQTIWLTPESFTSNSYTSKVVTNFPQGPALVTVFVNGIPSVSAYTVVDVPPTITITSTPLNYSNQSSGTVAFTANETATFECKVDSGTYTTCTSPFSYSNLANDQHTVSIKATDGAGNTSTSTHTWTVNTALAASSAILLPQTGQTKCYDAVGVEITCTGTGQDGEHQAGLAWPSPRFTDNSVASPSKLTVTDNLTGLIWVKNANLMKTRDPSFDADATAQDGAVTWQHGLDYVKKLNIENYLGHNDWRLPNRHEAESLVSRGASDIPAWMVAQGFTNVPTYPNYWTSTTAPFDSVSAWASNSGYVSLWGKTGNIYVLPVRSTSTLIAKTGQTTCYDTAGTTIECSNTGQDGELQKGEAWPTSRFSVNGDQTITDNLTGLSWLKDSNIAVTKRNWQAALDYVTGLNSNNYLGHNDWRLPNPRELDSLVNKQLSESATWLNGLGFINVQSNSAFWSHSTVTFNSTSAWVVDMRGNINVDAKTTLAYLWPVRGGDIQQKLNVTKSGNGTGTVTPSTGTIAWTGNVGTTRINPGDTVTLTATPSANMAFTGFTGCDSVASNVCTVTMNTTKNVTVTFTNPPPASPSNIAADSATVAGKLTVSWTNPSDADFAHIHIYRSTTSGALGTLVGDNVTGMVYTDTGLTSQTRYYYTIRAVDAGGNESTNTAQVNSITLDSVSPASVTGGSAGNPDTGGRLNLSWTASASGDLSHYHIYRSTGGVFYNLVHDNVTGNTFSDTGLTNGTRYYYSLTAVDTSGNESELSHTAHGLIFNTPTAPDSAPPSVVNCTGAISQPGPPYSGDTVQHSWIKPADSDFVLLRIYASTIDGALDTKVYEGTGTTYKHTGLTPGSTYYYTYRSVDAVGNETTNINQCSIVMQDTVFPSCPTGLTTMVINDTIKLDWTRSGSTDAATYFLYGDSGTGTINYTTPLATISQAAQTAFNWTSASLNTGGTYRYTLQVEDKVFNKTTNCGIVNATIPLPAPTCAATASIKNPHTGKKLGGNSVNVMAEVTGTETNVASVLFQYRPSGTGGWFTMPRRLVQHPNPDLAKPWFTLWDISPSAVNLPDGNYDIRALVTCKGSDGSDLSPDYITVTIDQAKPDTTCNDGETESVVHLIAPSTTLKGNADTGGTTKLSLPAGSLADDDTVTITDVAGTPPAGHQGIGVYRDINFTKGQHTLSNGKKATLEVSYKDDNDDGIVDGTGINAYDLQLCDYYNSTWTCYDSIVDTKNKKVRAETDKFSVYGLLKPPIPAGAGWNMLAVPLMPTNDAPYSVFSGATRINSYEPTTGTYPVPSSIQPGYAYWVQRSSAGTVSVTGSSTADAPFSIPIKKGWNMIGNPFRYKINVADLKVNVSGTEKIICGAETSGWVVGTLYSLANGSYQMSACQDSGLFEPWKGYWMLSDVTGTLIVPNTPAQ